MLQRKQAIHLQLNQLIDGLLLVVALWVAHAIRYYGTAYLDFMTIRILPFSEFLWLVFLIFPIGPLLLELQGFYQVRASKSIWRSVTQVLRAAVWLFVLIGACVIFFRLGVPSRGVLLLFGVLGGGVVILRDQLIMARLRRHALKEGARERVVLAGRPPDVESMKRSFTPELLMEMEIVSEIDIETEPVSKLVATLHDHAIGRVIFSGGQGHLDRIQEAIVACETEGVEAWLVADFIKTSIAKPGFDTLAGRPMLVFRTTPEISWELMLKGLIDRVGGVAGLILLSPLFLGAAIGIRLSSPGPILFRQMRGGRHGRPFQMYKFRTMSTDAEMRRAELAAFNQMSGPVFKIENDPRVTKFGAWLRRTSIDELPQLINVAMGDMSLVGPRPLPVYEVEKIEQSAQRRRLSVKPGMTCLWQVSGRNEVRDFAEWVRLDLEYIDRWSIWLDFRILLKTIPTVLLGLGAR